jgi:hypothetical protein
VRPRLSPPLVLLLRQLAAASAHLARGLGVPRRIGADRHDPRPRIVGADYSGVSMSRWPRSGQGCSKASVNACPGGGRTWTNAYRSHPRHPSWDAWPRSSQIPSVWPWSRPIRSTSAFSSSLVAT